MRSKEAIFLDLLFLAFASAIILEASSGVGADARLVPLIIGIPTVVGLVVLLLFDLFPRLRPGLIPRAGVGEGDTSGRGQDEVGEEEHFAAQRTNRRILSFGGWVIGFTVLSAAVGFLISVPIALLFFYKVLAKESWLRSVTIAAGTWLAMYALFGLLLDVQF